MTGCSERAEPETEMVGRPNKEHFEDIVLLIVIAAVLVYAVWKMVAG